LGGKFPPLKALKKTLGVVQREREWRREDEGE